MEHLRAALLRDRASDAVEEMDLPGCDPGRLERTYAQFALVNRAVAGYVVGRMAVSSFPLAVLLFLRRLSSGLQVRQETERGNDCH